MRGGLYLYRTCAIIDGVAPADVRRFHLDDEARCALLTGIKRWQMKEHCVSLHAEA